MSTKQTVTLAIAAAGAAVVVYLLAKRELAAGARAVGSAINPVSDQNVFYRGVNEVGGALTGDTNYTLGGWLYDLLNPEVSP